MAVLCSICSGIAGADGLSPRPSDLFPSATRLVEEPGPPPVTAAFADEQLLGWAFSTGATVGSLGYSGKPLDILVGLDPTGRIVGARLIEHQEPILATGATRKDMEVFLEQYAGRPIDLPLRVVRGRAEGALTAVSGATVSSLVINDAVLRSARAVARAKGLLGGGARIDRESFTPATWQELALDGSIVGHRFTNGEVEAALASRGLHAAQPAAAAERFLDLDLALATPARIGQNLLGRRAFEALIGGLAADDQLLFVAADGRWSVKGTNWVRTGAFDRLALIQDDRTIGFTKEDHFRIDALELADAPPRRELAVFVVRGDKGFRPDRPFRVAVQITGQDASGVTGHAALELRYALPQLYLLAATPAPAEIELWEGVWRGRIVEIGVLLLALVGLTTILFFQDRVAERRLLHRRIRLGFLLFTLLWLGWWESAQLSVINVLTFADALRTGFRWDVFLLEPLIFILWSYVAMALLFWGRGPFCGWLCPFGALQELGNAAAKRLRLPQLEVPFALHERLRTIKFVIFLGLFALALGSMPLARQVAEIEPFKTAIVLHFDREPVYVAWALLLLGIGLFVERPFCRYLCPLGAALAVPARLRQFEWLKRRRQCGVECRICAVRCPVQAIQPEGPIHPGECIYCLGCQVNYFDAGTCPPLIERHKRAQRRAALVAGDGGSPSA